MICNEYLLKSDSFKNWHAVDTSYNKALYAKYSRKNPFDQDKHDIKKNLAIDSPGAPLAVGIRPANQHDSQPFLEILSLVKSIQRSALSIVAADGAYDSDKLHKASLKDGFLLHISTNKRRKRDCPVVDGMLNLFIVD